MLASPYYIPLPCQLILRGRTMKLLVPKASPIRGRNKKRAKGEEGKQGDYFGKMVLSCSLLYRLSFLSIPLTHTAGYVSVKCSLLDPCAMFFIAAAAIASDPTITHGLSWDCPRLCSWAKQNYFEYKVFHLSSYFFFKKNSICEDMGTPVGGPSHLCPGPEEFWTVSSPLDLGDTHLQLSTGGGGPWTKWTQGLKHRESRQRS